MTCRRNLLLVFSSLLLVVCGCVTSGKSYVSKGQNILGSSKAVTTITQLPYQPIAIGAKESITFDEDAAVVAKGERRFFAKGFALPRQSVPYSVMIESYRMGTPDDPAIMYPEVKLLDENFSVIREIPSKSYVYRTANVRDYTLNTVFFVNGNKPDAHYLLITNRSTPDEELVTAQTNLTNVTPFFVAPRGYFLVITGTSTPPLKLKASAIGRIDVTLQEYRPKKVGE